MTRIPFPNHHAENNGAQRREHDQTRPWEQRQSSRHWCQREIVCETYDSLNDDFNSYPATLANQSHGGVMFIAGQAYDQGTPIIMRSSQRFGESEDTIWQKGVFAEVVWCQQPQAHNPEHLYQVGAKYFDLA